MPGPGLPALLRSGILAIVACGLLASCGRGGTGEGEGSPSVAPASLDATTLRRGNGPEPDTLDPQRAR
ncbi:MAG: hypothetical protein EHM60_10630, partial [Lysobacterales bacterium]